MPIVKSTPQTPPIEKPTPVRVTPPDFKGVTVDTKYIPLSSLLTHLEGASWTINYYSQVLGSDNGLAGQSTTAPAAIQQYKLIQKLELKVTTPLNQSQNTETKKWSITGQATVFPCGLIPNEGDMFIADVGDGREAVFEVTSSERRSIYKDAAYAIDYVVVGYSDTDGLERINDLNSKVVENLYYERDFLLNGQNPLITYSESQLLKKLQAAYREILDYYFDRFLSNETRTLLLPGQDYKIYDPFLTKAVLKMFRDESHANIKFIRELNVEEDDNYDASNIWTALLLKRRKVLVGAMRRVGIVGVRSFSADPRMNSVRYSGVDLVIYPDSPSAKSEDYHRHNQSKPLLPIEIKRTPARLVDLFDVIQISELNGLPGWAAPAIKPSQTDTYVFSPGFYNQKRTEMSGLEMAVSDYLDDKAYDLTTLTQLATSYTSWGLLEQFYQIPFLLAILRSAMRRL